jgi:hypothetical protein
MNDPQPPAPQPPASPPIAPTVRPAITAMPAVPAAPPLALPTAARTKSRRLSPVVIAAMIVAGIAALTLVAVVTRAPATASATPAQASASPASGHTPAATAAVKAPTINPSAPRWTAAQLSTRAGRPNGIVFELPADETVAVWHKRVRPVLTIRCVTKTTEVFVMTHSAAGFESTGRHTVKLGFDDGDATDYIWDHSVDHDALFAPDGAALMPQIAGAQRMTFSFTPFNMPPAVASFSVAGLQEHLPRVAKWCGST